MNAYNIAVVTGRMTKDPEIRYTNNNKAVATFVLAVNDGKDADGKNKSQFLTCVAWDKTAELIDQYFKKGDGLTVVGSNTVRSYEKDGKKRYTYELRVDAVGFPLTRRETAVKPNAFEEIADDGELPF